MCRVAYVKRPFADMERWFHQLECSAGGDGNGVAVGPHHDKGVDLSVEQTVGFVEHYAARRREQKKAPLPALWHTRRTSSGDSCDDLCHPFPCDGGWLVHNGHWGWAHQEAAKVQARPMSDTRLFSLIVDNNGFESAVKKFEPPGVWLHMTRDGSLRVWKRRGDLCYSLGVGALGSEPAAVGKWQDVADGLHVGEIRTVTRVSVGGWYDGL